MRLLGPKGSKQTRTKTKAWQSPGSRAVKKQSSWVLRHDMKSGLDCIMGKQRQARKSVRLKIPVWVKNIKTRCLLHTPTHTCTHTHTHVHIYIHIYKHTQIQVRTYHCSTVLWVYIFHAVPNSYSDFGLLEVFEQI